MRESSLPSIYERRCVLLDQMSAALRGNVVALWRLARGGLAVAEAVSRPQPARGALEFDLGALLLRWGRVAGPQSLWIGCRIDENRWHVAAVRSDPPEPPPTGIERRSPERIVVELGGLCLGALERVWISADQATVYLCSAIEVLENCVGRVRTSNGITPSTRAHMLADLASVADSIDGALRA